MARYLHGKEGLHRFELAAGPHTHTVSTHSSPSASSSQSTTEIAGPNHTHSLIARECTAEIAGHCLCVCCRFAAGASALWSAHDPVALAQYARGPVACAIGATVVFQWTAGYHDLVRMASRRHWDECGLSSARHARTHTPDARESRRIQRAHSRHSRGRIVCARAP